LKPRVREDKDEVAKCPFCKEFLKEPEHMETEMGECIGGRCNCGAVYCLDPTGHNVGEAYLDALVLAYGEGWGHASEDGYSEAVFAYDARTHRLSPVKEIRRLDSSGKIVFIKARNTAE
jgi:hypothetical protein